MIMYWNYFYYEGFGGLLNLKFKKNDMNLWWKALFRLTFFVYRCNFFLFCKLTILFSTNLILKDRMPFVFFGTCQYLATLRFWSAAGGIFAANATGTPFSAIQDFMSTGAFTYFYALYWTGISEIELRIRDSVESTNQAVGNPFSPPGAIYCLYSNSWTHWWWHILMTELDFTVYLSSRFMIALISF